MVTNPGIHLGESKQHLLLQVHYFLSLESPRSLGCSKVYACSLAVVDRAPTSLTSCRSAVQLSKPHQINTYSSITDAQHTHLSCSITRFNDVQGNVVVTMFPVHATIENSSKLVP